MDESKYTPEDLGNDVTEWSKAIECKTDQIDNIGTMYSAELASALSSLAQSPLTKGCNTQKLLRGR